MRVLITSIGSNTSIGVVKGLRLFFENSIYLVGTDVYESSDSAGSAFVDKFYKIAPASSASYHADIQKVIDEEGIEVVIPIHDTEVLAIANLAQKLPNRLFWAVSSPDVIAICNDKILSNQVAEEVGLKVPRYWKDPGSFSQVPVIAKQINGVSSRDLFVARTEAQLSYVRQMASDKYIFQAFVTNATEYTVDCYSNFKGVFLGGVARRRVETKDGISTKGVTENRPELLDACERFLNRIGCKGATNIQFMVNDAGANFIEINPRFSGGGILSYKAGFNSPAFTVMEATKGLDALDCSITYGLKMTRYWEEVFH